MTVTFVGWYGRDNCGDEAFKDVHRHILPGQQLRWICDEPQSADAGPGPYVLGGGDVFLDFYIDQIPGDRPFWAYGVGLGGTALLDQVVARRDRLRGIWLRNRVDVEALRARGVDARYSPDIVFNLRDHARSLPAPPLEGEDRKRLVLVLSNNLRQDAQRRADLKLLAYMEYFKHELAECLDYLTEFYTITMVPFSRDPNDYDPGLCAEVYSLMQRKYAHARKRRSVELVTRALSPLDTLALFRGADLAVSMKFHGLIFAALLGIPFVNIGMSRKNALFCTENGLPELTMEPFCFTKDRFLDHVKQAERPDLPGVIARMADKLAQEAAVAAAEFRAAILPG